MENKHTPGPWFPVDYAGSICIQNGPMYDDLDLLCYDSIFSDITPPSKETVEANANLMAAAPEMLEVLETIENDSNQVPEWLWNKIKEVIKKAKP